MAEIPNLDEWLLEVTAGLPRDPGQRYEFRCHPDVFMAIRAAADVPNRFPDPGFIEGSPAFGVADVDVRPELGSGRWELYGNGELLRSGRLGSGAAPEPALPLAADPAPREIDGQLPLPGTEPG